MTGRSAAATLLLLAALPAGATAQACGVGGSGAWLTVGAASYEVGAEPAGPVLGVGGQLAVRGAALTGRVRTLRLDDSADPWIGELAVAVPVVRLAGLRICPVARLAGSSATAEDAEARTLAVGAGTRVAAELDIGAGRAVPYVEVRALAARTDGDAFGQGLDATGYALGGELGAEFVLGRFLLRIAGSVDGLDDGLGLTPYPARSVEAGIGVHF